MISSNDKFRLIKCTESELFEVIDDVAKYPITDGFIYSCTDTGNVYIDDCSEVEEDQVIPKRVLINETTSKNQLGTIASVLKSSLDDTNYFENHAYKYASFVREDIQTVYDKVSSDLSKYFNSNKSSITGNFQINIEHNSIGRMIEKVKCTRIRYDSGKTIPATGNGFLDSVIQSGLYSIENLGSEMIYGIPVCRTNPENAIIYYLNDYVTDERIGRALEHDGIETAYKNIYDNYESFYLPILKKYETFSFHFDYDNHFSGVSYYDSETHEFTNIPELSIYLEGTDTYVSDSENEFYLKFKDGSSPFTGSNKPRVKVEGFRNITNTGADILLSFLDWPNGYPFMPASIDDFNNADYRLDITIRAAIKNVEPRISSGNGIIIEDSQDGAKLISTNLSAGSGIVMADKTDGSMSVGIKITSGSGIEVTENNDGTKVVSITGELLNQIAGLVNTVNDLSTRVSNLESFKSGFTVQQGAYGPSQDVVGYNGTTISVPYIVVDEQGRITSIANKIYTSVDNASTYVTYNTSSGGSGSSGSGSSGSGSGSGSGNNDNYDPWAYDPNDPDNQDHTDPNDPEPPEAEDPGPNIIWTTGDDNTGGSNNNNNNNNPPSDDDDPSQLELQ